MQFWRVKSLLPTSGPASGAILSGNPATNLIISDEIEGHRDLSLEA
jgi:hypothetical protein